jgi:hypothetical protein
MEYWRYQQDEFPTSDQAVALRRVEADGGKLKDSRDAARLKVPKRRKKMRQQSKRRNHKK